MGNTLVFLLLSQKIIHMKSQVQLGLYGLYAAELVLSSSFWPLYSFKMSPMKYLVFHKLTIAKIHSTLKKGSKDYYQMIVLRKVYLLVQVYWLIYTVHLIISTGIDLRVQTIWRLIIFNLLVTYLEYLSSVFYLQESSISKMCFYLQYWWTLSLP